MFRAFQNLIFISLKASGLENTFKNHRSNIYQVQYQIET